MIVVWAFVEGQGFVLTGGSFCLEVVFLNKKLRYLKHIHPKSPGYLLGVLVFG